MKKLTILEGNFVDAFMDTGSNSESYKFAYATDNMKDATVHNNGYKVANRDHVKSEIETRRADLAERCQVTQIKILEGYFKIIDDYNYGIRMAKVDDKKKNAASYRVANFVNSASVVAALKAIAEITGLTAPLPGDTNNSITINYINPIQQ